MSPSMQPLSSWRIKHWYLFDIIEEHQESQRKLLNLLKHDRTIPWYIVLSSDAIMVSALNNIEKTADENESNWFKHIFKRKKIHGVRFSITNALFNSQKEIRNWTRMTHMVIKIQQNTLALRVDCGDFILYRLCIHNS